MIDGDMKEKAKIGMWIETKRAVMVIARNRRVAEMSFDIEEKEFDEKLNDICEEAYKKYGKMSQRDIGIELMSEMLLEALTDMGEGE